MLKEKENSKELKTLKYFIHFCVIPTVFTICIEIPNYSENQVEWSPVIPYPLPSCHVVVYNSQSWQTSTAVILILNPLWPRGHLWYSQPWPETESNDTKHWTSKKLIADKDTGKLQGASIRYVLLRLDRRQTSQLPKPIIVRQRGEFCEESERCAVPVALRLVTMAASSSCLATSTSCAATYCCAQIDSVS